MYRLMRFFSLTTAAIVVLATFALVGVYHWHQTSKLLSMAQQRNVEVGRVLANTIWSRYSDHLTNVHGQDAAALRAHPATAAIDKLLRELVIGSSALKLRIFSTGGRTLYSSELREIGSYNEGNRAFQDAVRLEQSKGTLTHRESFNSVRGELSKLDVVESYIPIRDLSGAPRIIFELYSDATQDALEIRRHRIDVAVITSLAFGTLYCALLFLVRRADIIMRRQYKELESFNARLETQVERRTRGLMNQQSMISAIMKSERVRHGSLQEAMGALTCAVGEVLSVERVSIWQFKPGSTAIRCLDLFEFGSRRHSDGQEVHIADMPRYFDAILNKEIVSADNALTDPAMAEIVDSYLKPCKIASMLDAPIIVDGMVVGIVSIEHVGEPVHWSAEAKLLIVAVANLAALVIERIERTRMEEQLREANQMAESATRAKTEFLANMSHEIRTPMNGVFGMTEILLRTELSDRQRRQVETVQQSAKTLLTIINDILDISRIEAGKFELDRQDFDLRQCLEGAVAIFEDQIHNKDVELTLFVADDVPACIAGDAVRLRQIFVNLVGNAVKFTKQGEIALRATSVGRCDGQDMVRFEVCDTGIGIDPMVKSRLFVPFSQADTSISRRFGGTGLGLSISQHLVVMMGGQIRLESSPGKGTCVSFVLPLTAVDPVDQRPRADLSALHGKRILIVDDKATNREIVSSYLDGSGAETVTAENGAAALKLLKQAQADAKPFACAILDVIMPGMSGLDLARTIRTISDFKDLRLAFLTSLSWKGDVRMVRDLGVQTLLTKPIRRNELLEEVAALLKYGDVEHSTNRLRTPVIPYAFFNARVLVAEDNPVNVEVAREFLESFGCAVDIAADGLIAVDAVQKAAYDLILMDLQMPNLDGLGATASIRAQERAKSAWRTPIVGLTANAFVEDRVRCLAGDMDDYLSKPYTEDQLHAVLARWISAKQRKPDMTNPASSKMPSEIAAARDGNGHRTANTTASASAAGPSLETSVIDGLRRGRPDLLKRLIKTYLNYSPKAVEGLQKAAAEGNIEAVRMAAHSLKSSSASLGAMNLSGILKALEYQATVGEVAAIAPLVAQVGAEFARVRADLEAMQDASEEQSKVA